MQPIDVDASEAIEFLDRMQFFGGQRTWRELWADMPKKVQDADLAAFNRDVELLRKIVLSKVENTTVEVEPVRHGKWKFEFEHADSRFYRCSECNRREVLLEEEDIHEDFPYCHCGCKMDLED